MKTLMIKDLARTEELDRNAMSAVRGGTLYDPYYLYGYSFDDSSKHDFVVNASQLIGQTQSVATAVGNNKAFVDNDFSNAFVTANQNAHNNISF